MSFEPGTLFDRYRLEAVLGEGAMGRVYRAYDTRLGRRVALKVPGGRLAENPSADSSTDGVARIFREARAASMLEHPNAVAIYDVGESDGQAWLAMECIEGRPLRAFIRDESVPLEARLEWLVQIASVLSAAHARGIIHRDFFASRTPVVARASGPAAAGRRGDEIAAPLGGGRIRAGRCTDRGRGCCIDGKEQLTRRAYGAIGVRAGTDAHDESCGAGDHRPGGGAKLPRGDTSPA